MAHNDIPELDRAGLRKFGLTTGGIIMGLFGLFFPWVLAVSIPKWPWILGGVLGLWGLAHPDSLKPVYTGWMKFGLLLSKITTPIVMGVIFFVVVAPMALVIRLFGKDPMQRKLDETATSYRVVNDAQANRSVERPF